MARNLDISCIPDEKLPECWSDEKRMNVLFAPFRSFNANPHDWNSKIAFWRKMIELYCEYSKTYKFTIPELLKVFNKNGRSPKCLQEVVNEMWKLKEIKPVHEYLETPSRSWAGWATQVLVTKPIKWTFRTVKNKLVEEDKNQDYVHIIAIDKTAKELLENLPDNYKGKVIDMDDLLEVLKWPPERTDSLRLVLHKLACEGKAGIKEIANVKQSSKSNLQVQLIKIDNKLVKPISDIDVSIYFLEESESVLMKEIEKRETEVNRLREEAKSSLKKGHRQMAKSILVKKQGLEKQLTKTANALHNVHILLSKLHDVESDAEILSSYKLAMSVLQNTFKNTELTEDAVTETMLSLGELMDVHDDIQESLSQPIKDENSEELEKELAQLLVSDEVSNEEDIQDMEKEKEQKKVKVEDTVHYLEKKLELLTLPKVQSTDVCKTEALL